VSQVFLVEKDGGQRPAINLKGLNQFVRQEHFNMKGLHLLTDLQPEDWMAKMNPYLQVPIHPNHTCFRTFVQSRAETNTNIR